VQDSYVILLDEAPALEKSAGAFVASRAASGVSTVAAGAVNEPSIETATVTSTKDADALHRSYSQNPKLRAIAPVMPFSLHAPVETNVAAEADVRYTWGITAIGANTSPFDGTGVTVAVLDTGIQDNHVAFEGLEIVEEDFTGEGIGDLHGHGTHCAGTIFGQNLGDLRIGVARGIERALIAKVLRKNGSGDTDGIANGFLWALQKGAQVVSMSLGMDFPGEVERQVEEGLPADLATSRALESYRRNIDLFATLAHFGATGAGLVHKGAVIVAASGNASRRKANPEHKIAVAPPAAAEGIISVGAVGQSDDGLKVGAFSNTLPRIVGPGVAVRSARLGGGITADSGTSMAAPHVAGVAALWIQKSIEETTTFNPVEIENRVVGTGSVKTLAKPYESADVGAGLVVAPQA